MDFELKIQKLEEQMDSLRAAGSHAVIPREFMRQHANYKEHRPNRRKDPVRRIERGLVERLIPGANRGRRNDAGNDIDESRRTSEDEKCDEASVPTCFKLYHRRHLLVLLKSTCQLLASSCAFTTAPASIFFASAL